MAVLFVCTGNICRSPVAQLLLDAHIPSRSAGTRAVVGAPVQARMAQHLHADGVPSAGFVAAQLTTEMVDDAELIIGMTREHRSAAALLRPAALGRCFTLRELVRLAQVPQVRSASGNLPAVAAAASAARRPPAAGESDDIPDPYGESDEVYASTYRSIAADVRALIPLLG